MTEKSENDVFSQAAPEEPSSLFDFYVLHEEKCRLYKADVLRTAAIVKQNQVMTAEQAVDLKKGSTAVTDACSEIIRLNFSDPTVPFEAKMQLAHDTLTRDELSRVNSYAQALGEPVDMEALLETDEEDFIDYHAFGVNTDSHEEQLELCESILDAYRVNTQADLTMFIGDLLTTEITERQEPS